MRAPIQKRLETTGIPVRIVPSRSFEAPSPEVRSSLGQRAVRFDSAIFQTTFHAVFVRCRVQGIQLHRNFLALGAYLATLYDLLEGLDQAFAVRAAFDRAHPG